MRNGLSFDVEDWFHVHNYQGLIPRESWPDRPLRVADNLRIILDLLSRRGARATFFVLGWVAAREPLVVERIVREGHEVATHGYAHQKVTGLTPQAFQEDLHRSMEAIHQAGAATIAGYRAPSFSVDGSVPWVWDILADFGLGYDSSVFPTRMNPAYGVAGAPLAPYRIHGDLWEIPLSVLEVGVHRLPVGGGAYFRFYPFAVTRWAIRRINDAGRPMVVYLHPWEFDVAQPRVAGASWRTLRQTFNVSRTAGRLDRLLAEFEFGRLSEILDD